MENIRHVYRWDLDKTYLKTDFDSFRGLLRAAFEKARDKVNVAGSAALLRELRATPGSRVAIVSGSPRQMRAKLEAKLRLDGITWDEFVLKPNLQNLVRGRFRAIRDQVGYKLPALLEGRLRVPEIAGETLFGDDAEADAFVYSLYADLLAGHVSVATLAKIVERSVPYVEDGARVLSLATEVPRAEAVRRIFIHLDSHTPPARFAAYGSRVIPIYNYFQAAVILVIDGALGAPALVRVAAEMMQGYGYSLISLANSFQDLVRRGLAREEDAQVLRLAFDAHAEVLGALRPATDVVEAFVKRLAMIAGVKAPPARTGPIDYLGILEREGPPTRRKRRTAPRPPRAEWQPAPAETDGAEATETPPAAKRLRRRKRKPKTKPAT